MTSHHLTLPEMSPEMRLLLACAGTSLRQIDRDQVADLSRNGIDWEMFMDLIGRHRVHSLVYTNLRELEKCPVPKKVYESLKNRYIKNGYRALLLTAELIRILRLFDQEKIRAMPFKGPLLSMQIYGDPAIRSSGDIDLLLEPEDAEKAAILLSDNGYIRKSPDYSLIPRKQKAFLGLLCESQFYHHERSLFVELHWRWFHNPYLFRLDPELAWERAQKVKIDSFELSTLGIEDALLYLCVHGAQHMWPQLFWVCDIVGLLQKGDLIDWEALMKRANELGVERMFSQGVLLSHLLLGSPVPACISNRIKKDKAVEKLTRIALLNLIEKPTPHQLARRFSEHLRSKRYDLKLRRDLKYRLLGCIGGMRTSPNDWRVFPLPDRLFFLYYILRPFIRLWRAVMHSPYPNPDAQYDIATTRVGLLPDRNLEE